MRRPRLLALLAGLFLLAAGPLTAPAGAEAGPREFTLTLGGAVFWEGPGSTPADCGTGCWSYRLHVPPDGYRLRVGIDRPRLGDVWNAELRGPSGEALGGFSPGTDLYSAEIDVTAPEPGAYEVRVTEGEVADVRFRMRAALELDNGGLPDGHVLVPPDLQALPPWDFSFRMPITNGALGGASTGVDVPGGRPSCHPEEIQQEQTTRCLRMSFGVGNVGLGPLELEVGNGDPYQDRPLIQRVRYADGAAMSRDAGNAYYHPSHMHYHHDRAIGLELYRVLDMQTGAMEAAAPPQRKGFAHRDELLRRWNLFAPTWTKSGFGLLPGWGDYYEWDRPGNFIDFGDNGDGVYLLRLTADPDGYILDADRSDNVAYSLIRVSGDSVTHLQSGRGTDPWDPCRIPLPLGPEWQNSFELPGPRPEHCPDDPEYPDPD